MARSRTVAKQAQVPAARLEIPRHARCHLQTQVCRRTILPRSPHTNKRTHTPSFVPTHKFPTVSYPTASFPGRTFAVSTPIGRCSTLRQQTDDVNIAPPRVQTRDGTRGGKPPRAKGNPRNRRNVATNAKGPRCFAHGKYEI